VDVITDEVTGGVRWPDEQLMSFGQSEYEGFPVLRVLCSRRMMALAVGRVAIVARQSSPGQAHWRRAE
jgi:hypothetical protein